VNNRRKLVISLGAGALMAPFGAFAQLKGKVWRIGLLDLGSRQSQMVGGTYAALMEGLREFGYVEGRNFVLEARHAEGNADRLDGLAAELVRQNVDLILSQGNPASHAAQRATATIPIVITYAIDPVGDGFAKSLAQPGGNITGMSSGAEDTVQKLVELLILVMPKIKRIAVITNPANKAHALLLSLAQEAARQTGTRVLPIGVRTPEEIELGFATIARERTDAVIILIDAFLGAQRAQFAGLALKHRLPSIYAVATYAEVGGLMSYGPNIADNWRRASIFVDKILKGAKPSDIPFEQPTRYYFVINRKTANALGVKITGELLTRADKVIE
jgi:putative ABC transport system substrate-binding protein